MTALEAVAIVLVAVPALVSASFPLHAWLVRRPARRSPPAHSGRSLSVLVPVVGEEPGLSANLRHAIRQRWPGPYEVVVAGESENDPALVAARDVARRHPAIVRVVVAGPAGDGPGKVHRLAAAAARATGEWLVLLDSDARLDDPQDLDGFASALADPAVGLVTRVPAYREARGWAAVLANLIQTDLAGLFAVQAVWRRLGYANGSCLAIRRATLETLGGWAALRGRLLIDTALARDVRAAGLRVALWPHAVAIARERITLRGLLEQSRRWHGALASGLAPATFAGFAWLRSGSLMAAALAIAAPSPVVRVAAAAALAVRVVAAVAVERIAIRSRRPWEGWALLPLAELAAGLLWIPAWLDPRVRWRGRWYRLGPEARAREIPAPPPSRLRTLARRLRVRDWIVQAPLVVAVAAVYWCSAPTEGAAFATRVALVLAILTPLVAAGYCVNDLADERDDREKRGGQRRPAERRLLLAGAVLGLVAGTALSLALPLEKAAFVWATTGAGLAYSLPGVRLKERGALGLAAAAALQRLPAFILILEWPPRALWLAFALAAWLLLVGLLFILEHQIGDIDFDLRAGVRTWAARRGRGQAGVLRDRVVVALGATTLLAAGTLILGQATPAALAAALGLVAFTALTVRLIARQWSENRALPRRPTLPRAESPVRIYGAGLAGLAAAIKMAEWGRRVELCEQRLGAGGMAEERPFVHGTRQDPEALERWLDLPLAGAFERVEREVSWINGRRIVPGARHWNCLRGGGAGALDRVLLDRALAVGVEVRHGAPFRPAAPRERPTTVLATGHSRIAFEALGLPWEPLEAAFAVGPWEGETLLVSMRSDAMRDGYGYAAAARGFVYAMVFARGRLAPAAVERFRDELERREGLRLDDWRGLRGASALSTCFERDGFRLAGVASGMIDPFYLSGVGAALVSGGIAALAEVDPAEARRRFARLTWAFGPKLALARWAWPRPASRITLLLASGLEAMLGTVGGVAHAPER